MKKHIRCCKNSEDGALWAQWEPRGAPGSHGGDEARCCGEPLQQILRAYEILKTAVKLRVGRACLSAKEITRIAEILDEAAKAVEAS